MRYRKYLAPTLIPFAMAAALGGGGCYTVLSHPTTSVTDDQTSGYIGYSPCLDCHAPDDPHLLAPDPYHYVAGPFLAFYEPGWWECCAPEGPSEGAESIPAPEIAEVGRHVGSRGAGLPSVIPSLSPPPTGGEVPAPGVSTRSTETTPATPAAKGGEGRTLKPVPVGPRPEARRTEPAAPPKTPQPVGESRSRVKKP